MIFLRAKEKKGITLIALVITIIVLIILAGITIATLGGDNGILENARFAKFSAEISSIQEEIGLKNIKNNGEIRFGSINYILEIDSNYNDKLMLENGNLVYDPQKFSEEEKQWLENLGVKAKSNYYLIMMEQTKSKFKNQTNIGTISEFRELVNSGNFDYDIAYLVENIDLSNICSEEIGSWIPIGNEINNFNKKFDGGGYTIEGLYIKKENEDYQGLFLKNEGTIQNLNISADSYVSGHANTGAIVGNNLGIVQNCINGASVTGSYNQAGGIAGVNNGSILECGNIGNIRNSAQGLGGIVGWNRDGGKIENCYNTGKILTTNYMIGGVCGSNDGIISKCYNSGTIESNGYIIVNSNSKVSHIGGIAGQNAGEIKYCYNTGEVLCKNENAGGIFGYSYSNGIIKYCYNTGKISGSYDVGGIGGYFSSNLNSNVVNCYYLEGTANYGSNNLDNIDGIKMESKGYMTSEKFVQDLNKESDTYVLIKGKNSNYPLLNWQ